MIDLKIYGVDTSQEAPSAGAQLARITAVHRERYQAVCAEGEVAAVLKGSFFYGTEDRAAFPAVGDFVWLQYNTSGDSSIIKVLTRRTKFSRTDFSGHATGYAKTVLEQVVAANFDYVFILSSLNQDFNLNRIARYLSAAWQSGGLPVIVLTKADLCDDAAAHIAEVRRIAKEVPVVALSSRTGAGLEALSEFLQPTKTVVFLGMSGVGKSSLLNALAGEEIMAVNDIREDDSRGRHTTTHRQMIRLRSGVLIIDTPGMRELGLWHADEGINGAFAEIEALFAQCRFADCGHKSEPGCAVRAALEEGSVSARQWENYLAQKREAAFVDSKTGYLKTKKSVQKAIAKHVRGIEKGMRE